VDVGVGLGVGVGVGVNCGTSNDFILISFSIPTEQKLPAAS
jgi:hypothetical protein